MYGKEKAQACDPGPPDSLPPLQVWLPLIQPVPGSSQVLRMWNQTTSDND